MSTSRHVATRGTWRQRVGHTVWPIHVPQGSLLKGAFAGCLGVWVFRWLVPQNSIVEMCIVSLNFGKSAGVFDFACVVSDVVSDLDPYVVSDVAFYLFLVPQPPRRNSWPPCRDS